MSPAPVDKKSRFRFSNRIRGHPRLVEHWNPRDNTNPCVWYVNDQLLVSNKVYPLVKSALAQQGLKVTRLTTMFEGLEKFNRQLRIQQDVALVQLTRKDGKPLAPDSVVTYTRQFRKRLKGREREVSPNHILVPEWNGDACPYGWPTEYNNAIPPPPPLAARQPPSGSYSPNITLIDSGYLWDHTWGTNPLDLLLGHAQASPTPAQWPDDSGGWISCPPEVLNAANPTAPQRIDALAGHANFVAGVLAQRCNGPTINIWDHNGGFIGEDLSHVPTEHAVLHSLLKSQEADPTPLLMVTFAFPPLDGVLSSGWDTTFTQIAQYNPNFLIVAPAGNQGTTERRYPAALAAVDPRSTMPALRSQASPTYPKHVIGVGSLDPTGRASSFTNRGVQGATSAGMTPDKWVVCAAIGEQVPSSFLHADLPPEDAPATSTAPHNFAATNWALWQGTCFAAPKIVSVIAKYMSSSTKPPYTAWNDAINDLNPPAAPAGLGRSFAMLG